MSTMSSVSVMDLKQMFLSQMKAYLDRHKMKDALELFASDQMKTLIATDYDIIWELIPLVCHRLRGLNEFRFKTFQVCEQLLFEISVLCKPKEVLIAFLAELENDSLATAADLNCFKAILRPLEYVLIQLPTKRNETLKWVLSTLNSFVAKLDVQSLDDYQFEPNEKLFIQNDPNVRRIVNMLPLYIAFIETFVNEVDITRSGANKAANGLVSSKTSDPHTQRSILLKTLIRLLDHPLLHMDLSNDTKSESREIALKVVQLIAKLQPNIYTLFERIDLITVVSNKSGDNSDIELTKESFMNAMANISYLVICESVAPINFHPSIYTHVYMLGVHLQFIDILLQRNLCLIYEKGLLLAQTLLSQVNDSELESTFLDVMRRNKLDKSLIKVMVYSGVKSHRKTALNIFKKLVACFDNNGRFKLLYSILSKPHPSAVKELMIALYKDYLFTDPLFLGPYLQRMIKSAISASLPDGVESDLLESNHTIFATLNLIRYVCLKDDKSRNESKIWDIKSYISCNLLKPLHKAIDMSRAHYSLELRKQSEEQANDSSETVNFEVKIAGNKNGCLPNLPADHNKQAIAMALQNFDLIESVLVRVEEIMDE